MIQNKASKCIGILYRSRHIFQPSSLKLIYFSFIHSYINYANITWGSNHKSKLMRLRRQQKHFYDGLESIFSNLNRESPFCSIVLGDFNAKCHNWWSENLDDNYGYQLDPLSTISGFTQLIKQPTNLEPNNQASSIDLMFASQPNLVSDSGVHPSLYQTCHHQVYAKIDFEVYSPPPCGPMTVPMWNTTLLNIFRNYIPHKNIKRRYKMDPWITNEIKTSLREKNRLYKKNISKGRTDNDLLDLNDHARICSERISESKTSHFRELANKLNGSYLDPKAYWSILNGFLGKSKIPLIPPLLVNNSFETDFLKKANMFNEHFSSQCSVLNNSSILPELSYLTNSRLSDILINHDGILKIIKDLNPSKAHGFDGISIRMIKMCDKSIVTPLIIIFNNAILTNTFPDIWKKGSIVPFHKKESRNLVKSYRPISLLPICGKIFEKVIYNSLF